MSGLVIAVFMLSALGPAQQDVITKIEIHGNRRIPGDSIKARIFTREGDVYDQAAIERDFNALWNTGYFEDIRFEREQTPKGWRLNIYVKERPTIREIDYVGLSSVSKSDVLDRFKLAKVGLSVESQYDPTKVKKAEVTIKDLLSEHGRQFATVRTEVRPIPPAAVGLTFVIKEGPKVKVGKITTAHDGTKIQAACSGPTGWSKEYMQKLLAQLDRALDEVELQVLDENADAQAPGYHLPAGLSQRKALREEIKKGLAEADRGDFAADKDVERTLKKWTRRAG